MVAKQGRNVQCVCAKDRRLYRSGFSRASGLQSPPYIFACGGTAGVSAPRTRDRMNSQQPPP
jgi:hypothetical protein